MRVGAGEVSTATQDSTCSSSTSTVSIPANATYARFYFKATNPGARYLASRLDRDVAASVTVDILRTSSEFSNDFKNSFFTDLCPQVRLGPANYH